MPNGQPENFFALVEGNRGLEVRRLMMNRDAQEALAAIFQEAQGAFLNGDFREIPYDGVYKPEPGEMLTVDPFELPEDVSRALEEPTLFPSLNLRAEDAPPVKAIFTGEVRDGEPFVLLQAFQSNQYLHNKRFSLSFSQEMFRPLDNPGFNVRGELHAVYRDGKLLFRNDWWVKRMLDLSEHYREATDAELEDFLDLPSVALDDREAFYDNADTWIRKRVALINDRRILEDHSASEIRDRAGEIGLTINVRENDGDEQVVFPDDKSELKQTLRFLNEDMYAGPITEDRFVSTSKRRIDNG